MDHGQCLTEETLTDYLEGGLDPAIKAASEVHLVGCDDCRSKLSFFMRVLDDKVSPEEEKMLQAITVQWDKRDPGHRVQPRVRGLKRWSVPFAAAAAVLLMAAVSVHYIMDRTAEPKSAVEVVGLLLAQHRPFEPRMSGQPHLPIVLTRGPEKPGVAYGLLAGEMTRLSADSHQMGRFYLLQKDFMRAIDYLELAEREVGARAEIHNDLGVAYLESGGEARMQKAAVEFRHALQADPAFAAAVFNLGLFYERTGAAAAAQSEWKRYLQLDPDSPWAQEARSRVTR